MKLIRIESQTFEPLEEFNLCEVTGRGALYQVTIAAQGLGNPNRISYLKACMRAYTNGSKTPIMLSCGLEDYFPGTYYFDSGTAKGPAAHKQPPITRYTTYTWVYQW